MLKKIISAGVAAVALSAVATTASAEYKMNSKYRAHADELVTFRSLDGGFDGEMWKYAIHWAPEAGTPIDAPEALVIIAHGSGGLYHRNLKACGSDALTGAAAELCKVDSNNNLIFRADKDQYSIPAGPETLEDLMDDDVIGKYKIWPWLLRQAVKDENGVPRVKLHIVAPQGFYTAPSEDEVLDVLRLTDIKSGDGVTRNTPPHYNWGEDGVQAMDDNEDRPFYVAPEARVLADVLAMYDLARTNGWSTKNVMTIGISNGGSGTTAWLSVPEKLPAEVKEFLELSIQKKTAGTSPDDGTPGDDTPPATPTAPITVLDIVADAARTNAFDALFNSQGMTADDLLALAASGATIDLTANGAVVTGTAGSTQMVEDTTTTTTTESVSFSPFDGFKGLAEEATLRDRIVNAYGDIYSNTVLGTAFYPGCRLDGYMFADSDVPEGMVDAKGRTQEGTEFFTKAIYNFGENDSIYSSSCDQRMVEAAANAKGPAFSYTGYGMGSAPVQGFVATGEGHGFEYEPADPALGAFFIERVVNAYLHESGLRASAALPSQFQLPADFYK